MEFLQGRILALEQEIKDNTRDYRKETDPLQAERLKEIIERDTATLNNLYHQIAQSAPPPCKYFLFLVPKNFIL
jgi:hypothetical protein